MDPCIGQSDVHTQPFAFCPFEEDDESVKISNTTSGRSSALISALAASRSGPSASQNANFYSIQMNPFPEAQISQLIQNKALHFFYSIQMNGHQSLLTNH